MCDDMVTIELPDGSMMEVFSAAAIAEDAIPNGAIAAWWATVREFKKKGYTFPLVDEAEDAFWASLAEREADPYYAVPEKWRTKRKEAQSAEENA